MEKYDIRELIESYKTKGDDNALIGIDRERTEAADLQIRIYVTKIRSRGYEAGVNYFNNSSSTKNQYIRERRRMCNVLGSSSKEPFL